MVTTFWFDSDDLATTALCARVHVEVDVAPDSYEILGLTDEDTQKSLNMGDLSDRDRAYVVEVLQDKMADALASSWSKGG